MVQQKLLKTHNLKSYAKVNLDLNVIKKTKKNKHLIESFVVFISLYDQITLREIYSKSHKIYFKGKFSRGINKKNSIFQLLNLLDEKKILRNKKFKISVKKNIPLKSGMGGGSMNVACILKFLVKKNFLKVKEAELFAKKIGSDVILGLNNSPKILLSNGQIIEIKKKIKYSVLLIKPQFGCSTKEIFQNNTSFSKRKYFKNRRLDINHISMLNGKNDLEASAFKKYPMLKNLKNRLLVTKKPAFVRMTGSGSTLVVYFKSKVLAKNALKNYKRKFNKCWCILSKII